jgi:hypothetical protein
MKRLSMPVITALLMAGMAGGAAADERFEDAIGDVDGDAPDIVAVTVSEPEGQPIIRFEVELAPGRPFGTDMESWTDVLFLALASDDQTDDRGVLDGDSVYITGTHGVTLALQRHSLAPLLTPEDEYYYVVGIDGDDTTIGFRFDPQLVGSPRDLYWQLLVGVEREDELDRLPEGEAEGDAYPNEGEPPAHYRLSGWSD